METLINSCEWIFNKKHKKLLGVKNDHVKSTCKRASGQLRAPPCLIPYMTVERRKLIMNFFPTLSLIIFFFIFFFQDVTIEMLKVKNSLAPELANDLFGNENENHYNLSRGIGFRIPFVNSFYHGSQSMSCLVPKIWYIVLSKFKLTESINGLKKSIKKWVLNWSWLFVKGGMIQ